jgi:hypothetical protein
VAALSPVDGDAEEERDPGEDKGIHSAHEPQRRLKIRPMLRDACAPVLRE